MGAPSQSSSVNHVSMSSPTTMWSLTILTSLPSMTVTSIWRSVLLSNQSSTYTSTLGEWLMESTAVQFCLLYKTKYSNNVYSTTQLSHVTRRAYCVYCLCLVSVFFLYLWTVRVECSRGEGEGEDEAEARGCEGIWRWGGAISSKRNLHYTTHTMVSALHHGPCTTTTVSRTVARDNAHEFLTGCGNFAPKRWQHYALEPLGKISYCI